jgi:hypothetical protein
MVGAPDWWAGDAERDAGRLEYEGHSLAVFVAQGLLWSRGFIDRTLASFRNLIIEIVFTCNQGLDSQTPQLRAIPYSQSSNRTC